MALEELAPHAVTDRFRLVPGIVVALVAVAIGVGIQQFASNVSPLLSALVLGIALANVGIVPAPMWSRLRPGFTYAGRRFLRAGIVLLGLQIVMGDILGLGLGLIVLVIAIVTFGILITLGIGALLGVPLNQRILIACGFSICGAAAIAGTSEVIEAEEEDVAAGIALVALFGTAMIVIVPTLASLIGLSDKQTGMWAGGSIHEVAQVVAVGGSVSSAALTTAVLIKLARVMMLAPVATVLGIWHRRSAATAAARPPILPLFVAGFIAMALLRTTGIVPGVVVDVAKTGQLWLLAAAMFSIGCGCQFSSMKALGWRPLVLGLLSTMTVATISLIGVVALY